jgi:hypothetical protein
MFQKMGAKKNIEKVEAKIAFIETGREVAKPTAIKRVSTEYADLDKLSYGGTPSNYPVVLSSPSCDERDLLIKSFLETPAKRGKVTFYITIDPARQRSLQKRTQQTSTSLFAILRLMQSLKTHLT